MQYSSSGLHCVCCFVIFVERLRSLLARSLRFPVKALIGGPTGFERSA